MGFKALGFAQGNLRRRILGSVLSFLHADIVHVAIWTSLAVQAYASPSSNFVRADNPSRGAVRINTKGVIEAQSLCWCPHEALLKP